MIKPSSGVGRMLLYSLKQIYFVCVGKNASNGSVVRADLPCFMFQCFYSSAATKSAFRQGTIEKLYPRQAEAFCEECNECISKSTTVL